MKIPFLDLRAAYLELKPEIDAAIARVLDSGHYILGPEVEAFEAEYASYCEAQHAIGVANGLDPKVLSEIMRRSSGGNWALEKYNPFPGVHENAPASKGYAGGFGTDLMLKDLGLSQENAMAMKASTPLGGMARAIYAAHSIAGHGGEDFSSVIKMLQKKG